LATSHNKVTLATSRNKVISATSRDEVAKRTPNSKAPASNNKTRQNFNEELTTSSSSFDLKRKSNQMNDYVEVLIEETNNNILNPNKRPKKDNKGQNTIIIINLLVDFTLEIRFTNVNLCF
jgi:hypothetical protein